MAPQTPLLDQVQRPADLRRLEKGQLRQLADELRAETISAVLGHRWASGRGARRGRAHGGAALCVRHAEGRGDLGCRPSGLSAQDPHWPARAHPHTAPRRGVVGFHQARRERIRSRSAPRMPPLRSAPRSASAVARDREGRDNHVIAVIGDGSMSAGMAYEAMNNAAETTKRLIVILNDNDMRSPRRWAACRPIWAAGVVEDLSRHPQDRQERSPNICPAPMHDVVKKAEEYARTMVTGGTFFEELGFHYLGPFDGHDLDTLTLILQQRQAIHRSPGADPCRHQEGQGLRAGRKRGRQISRRRQVQRRHRRAGQERGARRNTPRCSAQSPDPRSREGRRKFSPSPRRCPRAPGSTCSARDFPSAPSMSASPSSTRSPSPPGLPPTA